jgi:hypothetical protein
MSYGDENCQCHATHHCGCHNNPVYSAADAAMWGTEADYQQQQQARAAQAQQAAQMAIQRQQRQQERRERRQQREAEPVPIPIRCIPIMAILLMLIERPLVLWAVGEAGFIIFGAAFCVWAGLLWEPWRYMPVRHPKQALPQASSSATVTRESSAPLAPQLPTWRDRAEVIRFPDRTRRPDPAAVEPQEVA